MPPFDSSFDYTFHYPPIEDVPVDWLYPDYPTLPAQLPPPPPYPEWPPFNTLPPFDDTMTFIIYLPVFEYPPESPEWVNLDWPWPDEPMLLDDFGYPLVDFPLPPEFADPWDWTPVWDVPLDPLDWLWPEEPSWQPWPDMVDLEPFPTLLFEYS